MSTHSVNAPDERALDDMSLLIWQAVGRPANAREYDGATATWTYSPDLTAAESTLVAEILRAAVTPLTRTERNAIEPQLVTGRAFLALSQSQFMALTAAERDRLIFDNTSAQWRVLFRLLRD
jgi:hypothetical protein